MSVRHPIIVVTGSSGAGTTSVRNTFQQIFRPRRGARRLYRGRRLPPLRPAGMRHEIAEEAARGNDHFSHFGLDANLLEELETLFRDYGDTGTAERATTCTTPPKPKLYGRRPEPSPPWRTRTGRRDLLFYEGLHGAVVTRSTQHRAPCRPENRRRAGDQSRMDPENPPRPADARLFHRRGDGDDLAPHAGLCALHLPAIHRDRHQLPARPDGGYVQPIHRPLDSDGRRIHGHHPLRNPRGIDFPYLLAMVHDSFMSRANSIVIPGNKLDLAMQLILTPLILRLIERQQRSQ